MRKGKDPAFLFYSSDFTDGVSDLTMEERGQYITMLARQHQAGCVSERWLTINIPNVSKYVLKKFVKSDDNYENSRLKEEIEIRKRHRLKQFENGKKGGRPITQTEPKHNPTVNPNITQRLTQTEPKQKPLVNVNVNEDVNVNIDESVSVDELVLTDTYKVKAVTHIIEQFNIITGSKYQTGTKTYRTAIKARLADNNWNEQELIDVIELQFRLWKDDPEMQSHINPETIFRASKYPKYAEAVRRIKETGEIPKRLQRTTATDSSGFAKVYLDAKQRERGKL